MAGAGQRALSGGLRGGSSVLLHERYAPPWAVDIPAEPALRAALGLTGQVRVVPFHLVRAGAFDLSHGAAPPQRVDTHEIAICPSGAAHRMSFGRRCRAVPLADVLAGRGPPMDLAGGDATELICGVFELRSAPLNPLLLALPQVLKVHTSGAGVDPLLTHAVAMLALEVAKGPGSFVLSRLLEVLFAEAIRAYGRSASALTSGWFRGIGDARIGAALAQVHRDPGARWSVAALARTVAMSPSRFAACFRERTGQSAMSYVAAWRMNLACQRLRAGGDRLDVIATAVGYQDVAAFSRAFKSLVGQSPAHWRLGAAATATPPRRRTAVPV